MDSIKENHILKTYQFDDTVVGEVIPYTERVTKYGHLKIGDKILIKRATSYYKKKQGRFFQLLEGIVRSTKELNALERNGTKNNRSLKMLIEITKIV